MRIRKWSLHKKLAGEIYLFGNSSWRPPNQPNLESGIYPRTSSRTIDLKDFGASKKTAKITALDIESLVPD